MALHSPALLDNQVCLPLSSRNLTTPIVNINSKRTKTLITTSTTTTKTRRQLYQQQEEQEQPPSMINSIPELLIRSGSSSSSSVPFHAAIIDADADLVPSTLIPHLRRRQRLPSVPKSKVIFIVGATGTGKSRLAIDLASAVGGEVVNSDKMQVYEGLDVVTNKVTEEECAGVPHHLIGFLDPHADFTASDFRVSATAAIHDVLSRGSVPVVAGGSNSYIEKLVDDHSSFFRSRFDCCFLWVDVGLRDLDRFASERVDRMVAAGLVEEVRQLFDPCDRDYTRGVRRAIGVPEMDAYLRAEAEEGPESPAARRLLEAAIAQVKANTSALVRRQLQKIHRLSHLPGWHLHRLDATEALRRRCQGRLEADASWERLVAGPASSIVTMFLDADHDGGGGYKSPPHNNNKEFAWQPVAVPVAGECVI